MSSQRCDSTPSLKPVFALGGSVSGYASMGSIESLSGDLKRENKVWSTDDIIGEHMDEVKGSRQGSIQTYSPFKSSFAKELEEENLNQSMRIKKCLQKEEPGFKSDFAVNIKCVGDCVTDTACIATKKVVKVEIPATLDMETRDEFSRVKLENEILKLKLKSFNQDDEKYKKLQSEIEQLTWQLSKMEQSRLVYENATNQLGSFLEMVSTKLTNTKVGEDAEPEADGRMSRRRSRASDKIQTLPRRKSTTFITNTHSSKSRSKLQFEDPSLSRSTSCTSSSLDSSSISENGKLLLRGGDDKTLETVTERRYRKWENREPEKSANDDLTSAETDITCDSSITSSCLSGEERLAKTKSRTKKALGRITSFMRKDKSKNFNLEDVSKNSIKYSSEHFSEPSSMSIIGFRGIWSLRNY